MGVSPMIARRLIIAAALFIIVLALLSKPEPPRDERAWILKFPKVA